ncbi:MAG TPA: DUF4240 domain-containing protein [Tepidisphaeraceae bacterium]|jgi:hypothetical protein|nr:DUF4240 domain-containing protein [Tepidisphaeraceae bacterium]
MDDSTFWNIIETAARAAGGDADATTDGVRVRLTHLQPGEIESFQTILGKMLNLAYSYPLWGAAYLINGGCSDDGFEYFRCWLITRGRETFEAALAEPDSLAGVVTPDEEDSEHECESLLYVARRAYETVAGVKMAAGGRGQARKPSGSAWDFDDQDERARRLPRLASLYP